MDITFQYDKLSESDKKFYDKIDDAAKKKFEKEWINIEKQRVKLEQQKARLQKMKTVQSNKERKAETRYKIQLGGEVYKVLNKNGITLSENQLHLVSDFLFSQEERGGYFTKYITSRLTPAAPISAPDPESYDELSEENQEDLI